MAQAHCMPPGNTDISTVYRNEAALAEFLHRERVTIAFSET